MCVCVCVCVKTVSIKSTFLWGYSYNMISNTLHRFISTVNTFLESTVDGNGICIISLYHYDIIDTISMERPIMQS